jgi:hypothetical protein
MSPRAADQRNEPGMQVVEPRPRRPWPLVTDLVRAGLDSIVVLGEPDGKHLTELSRLAGAVLIGHYASFGASMHPWGRPSSS